MGGHADWGLSLSLKQPNPGLPVSEEVEIPKLTSPSPSSAQTSTITVYKGHFHNFNQSDDSHGNGKKLRLSNQQIAVLEQAFREHSTLNTKQKMTLSRQANLSPRQVEVWFQNRRARTKLKQTEVECDYLKRFCENLREENRKLQREVQYLRGFKLLSAHRHRASMCPSCNSMSSPKKL